MVPMFELPRRWIVGLHSSIVSPPQNNSKTVDLISPFTGKPRERASVAARVLNALRTGEFITLNSRRRSISSASDLSAKAVSVSWKSSLNSAIKGGFYHRGHGEHRVYKAG